MTEYTVASTDELDDGDRIVVQLEGQEIGIFCVDGEYYAYTNWCIHQSGPVCEGMLSGTQTAEFDPESLEVELTWDRDGEIIACPWHGWEYDIGSGECLSREKARLVSYPVSTADGDVIVSL
jgi:nitrite reductase/ring-hydroxylating ferredoxin subunit